MQTLLGSDGRQYTLGELLKSGGAGSVYRVLGDSTLVAKIYHAHVERDVYERKVLAMLTLSPDLPDLNEHGKRYVQIAWPKALLRDAQGRFLGFLMPAVDIAATSELECVMQEKQARRLGLPTGLGAKLTLAANLAAVIAELHRRQHRVVDLKPVNLRFYPQALYMALLDCDGFSIQGQGERFPGPQFTVDYLAPEFHSALLEVAGEEAQDRFALAVIVFQLLNFGIHPFSGRPADERVPTDIPSRIAGRFYPYGLTPHARMQPNPASGHAAMPAELRSLFDRAFSGPPAARPSALAWSTLLRGYAQRAKQLLSNCPRDASHQYFTGLPCAACARAGLIASAQQRRPPARRPGLAAARAATAKPAAPAARNWQPHVARKAIPRPPPPLYPPPTIYTYPYPARVPTRQPTHPAVKALAFGLWGLLVFVVVMLFAGWRLGPPPPPTPVPYVTHRPIPPLEPKAVPIAAVDPAPIVDPAPVLDWLPVNSISLLPRGEWQLAQQRVRRAAEALADKDLLASQDVLRELAEWQLLHAHGAPSRVEAGIRFLEFMPTALQGTAAQRAQLRIVLRKWIETRPYNAELASEWAWLALVDGQQREAQEGFLRAIWAQPEQPYGWYGLAASLDSDRLRYGLLTRFEMLRGAGDPETEPLGNFTSAAMQLGGRDYRRFRVLHARGLRNALALRGKRVPDFVERIANQVLEPQPQ